MSDLHAKWNAAWQLLGSQPVDSGLVDELLRRWAEPHRRYHSVQHLRDCLELLEGLRCCAEHPGEVEVAVWFHDAIYDPRADDNEARSAAWAKTAVLDAGASALAAARVFDLVMSTRHDAVPATPDARLLCDVDLSILAADGPRFDAYEDGVRAEFDWVTDARFYAARGDFIRALLRRERIFHGAEPFARFEARARENLRRAERQCRERVSATG